MMTDADGAKSDRIMNAVLKMKKFDIAELKQAYDGHA
jgi:predicted 3-demethylubiquinone-9 3-methyltransferase (glyoxalase superfamily)